MVEAMQRMIAFGEPRLDADLASILGPVEPAGSSAAAPNSLPRLAIEAFVIIVAAIVLAQFLPGPAEDKPEARAPVASGPLSTPPGGILPEIRNDAADREARAIAAKAPAKRPPRARNAARAARPAAQKPPKAVAPAGATGRETAIVPERRAGPRKTVSFQASASREQRKTLIAGGNAPTRMAPHGPRHHRRPGR